MPCVSGICCVNRLHIKQFPSSTAYDFDIVVDASEISVEQFATRVQIMLVEYPCIQYCNAYSNWCERY
jgi:hypothetical protein